MAIRYKDSEVVPSGCFSKNCGMHMRVTGARAYTNRIVEDALAASEPPGATIPSIRKALCPNLNCNHRLEVKGYPNNIFESRLIGGDGSVIARNGLPLKTEQYQSELQLDLVSEVKQV